MGTMKQIPKIAAIAVTLLSVGVGCQRDLALNSQNGLSELNSDAFAVADFYDVQSNIQDATLEKSMSMDPVFRSGGHFRPGGGYKGGRGGHLGGILRDLNVTEDQKTAKV